MIQALIRGALSVALGVYALVLLGCGGRSGHTGTDPEFSIEPGGPIFWQHSNAPGGNDFRSLSIDIHGHLFAASSKGGVFRSADQGRTWVEANAGLTVPFVYSLATSVNGKLLAGTDGNGVFCSTDDGTTWLPAGLETMSVWSLLTSTSGIIFAGTSEGVFRSDDEGSIWTQVNNGLTNRSVLALALAPIGDILAGTYQGGIYVTHDSGGNWLHTSLTSTTIRAFDTAPDGNTYAATPNGVFRSTDNGITWSQQNAGLSNTTTWTVVADLARQVFVGTKGGVFRSLDHGSHWQAINDGLKTSYIRSCLLTNEGYLLAGTNGGGIYRSVQPAALPK